MLLIVLSALVSVGAPQVAVKPLVPFTVNDESAATPVMVPAEVVARVIVTVMATASPTRVRLVVKEVEVPVVGGRVPLIVNEPSLILFSPESSTVFVTRNRISVVSVSDAPSSEARS